MSNKRSHFGSLSDRTAPGGNSGADAPAPIDAQRGALPRHVWIDRSRPGLLLAWARTPDGAWWGQTVTVDDEGRAEESWVIANRLTPA